MSSPDDERLWWLREQLDEELDDVRSSPGALREVLDRARAQRPWWRGRVGPAGVPAWFLAAAAVLVVAVLVPFGVSTLLRPPGPPERLASTGIGVLPRTAAPTVPPTTPSASPRPTRSAPVRVPTASPKVLKTSPQATVAPTIASKRCVPASASAGTATAQVDVDGDGTPDPVTLAPGSPGTLAVAQSTAGLAQGPFTTASPYVTVLPVEADGTPGAELMVITRGAVGKDGSVGMDGTLYDVQGCALAPVLNAQGVPYRFEIGSSQSDTVRAGVACQSGTLFGVTSVLDPQTGWTVTRTPVGVSGGRARNGTPVDSTLAADDPTADALRLASCGAATPQPLG
jgi:hypothetical protein